MKEAEFKRREAEEGRRRDEKERRVQARQEGVERDLRRQISSLTHKLDSTLQGKGDS